MKSSLKIDEREYCSALDSLQFSQDQKALLTQKLVSAGQEQPKHTRKPLRRTVTVALCCVLAVALSMTVLAAGLPDFRAWLFGPDSGVADTLTPVSAVGNNDGLSLEVLGATGNKNDVCVYFTLQDTAGENRLGEDMIVGASVKLNDEYPEREDVIEGGMERSTEVVKYDPETQTALCKYQMTTGKLWDNNMMDFASEPYDATGAEVRLRVKKIIVYTDRLEETPIDLSEWEETTETLPIQFVRVAKGVSYGEFEQHIEEDRVVPIDESEHDWEFAREYNRLAGEKIMAESTEEYYNGFYDEDKVPVVLKPGTGSFVGGREYAQITAVGFIDGKLHVQYRNYGYFQDTENFTFSFNCAGIKPLNLISFRLNDKGAVEEGDPQSPGDLQSCYYEEVVYDIGPEDLMDHSFFGQGCQSIDRWVNFMAENFTLEENTPERVQELLK